MFSAALSAAAACEKEPAEGDELNLLDGNQCEGEEEECHEDDPTAD